MSETVEYRVDEMACEGCVATVTACLQALPAIEAVQVSLALGRATVQWRDAPDDALVAEALQQKGFPARRAEAR
ncbi:MAG: heavy-metal-associated domain-containing protein [Myxococcales bacterium]|nr:heavy-metal-associated domain-containing protein [Myxococcales bacterium]